MRRKQDFKSANWPEQALSNEPLLMMSASPPGPVPPPCMVSMMAVLQQQARLSLHLDFSLEWCQHPVNFFLVSINLNVLSCLAPQIILFALLLSSAPILIFLYLISQIHEKNPETLNCLLGPIIVMTNLTILHVLPYRYHRVIWGFNLRREVELPSHSS